MFEALTTPEHVRQWWGRLDDDHVVTRCEIDLRPGGAWRYGWRNAHGREFTASGTYREVDPPNRLVQVMKNQSGDQQTNTTTFTEENGRTTVTVSQLHPSKAARDQGLPYAKVGTESNYAKLDTYLASIG